MGIGFVDAFSRGAYHLLGDLARILKTPFDCRSEPPKKPDGSGRRLNSWLRLDGRVPEA